VVEIYRVLAFIIIIDYVLVKYPNSVSELSLMIESDCQSVLDDL